MTTPKTLSSTITTSAAQAFTHPLPQIRTFHRSLTLELDEKNARLRTLVGGSYRQLLGTAETILQMRDDIGLVEEKLGRVGRGCGRSVVGGKAAGLGKMREGAKEGTRGEKFRWAARRKVLEGCVGVVGRLLRKKDVGEGNGNGNGKKLVQAAKVLVLSRLLAKSVGDMVASRSQEDQLLVDELKRKLGTLRRKLLRAIEKTMENTGGEGREDLLMAMAAHSLATSSGTKDVVRHFLHVRGEAMAFAFDDEDTKQDTPGVLRALELYTRTLLDVQALVPRRLAEALASLKTKSLLKDESIRTLESLRLDVCEKWFGDEILFFTPYIRHDDLEVPNAVEMLKGWAKKASEVMLSGLSRSLEQMSEFKTVVGTRTRILEIWIKEGGKAKGFDPSLLLDSLREAINARLVALLESRASKLHLVATEIEGTLGTWQAGITDLQSSLWATDMLEMDINHGAGLFKCGILARTYGRNDAVSRVWQGYQTWRRLIDDLLSVLDQLRKQRWDDDLEDIEDDLSVESRNALLSTDDPKMLQTHLDTSLEGAYSQLNEKIAALLAQYGDSDHIGQMSMYILRILRDIRASLPSNSSIQGFGLELVEPLHQTLASTVSAGSLQIFAKMFGKKKVAGRALWEGTPELPVQPSPGTFRFLHCLALAMAGVGADLWSPAAVTVLKQHIRVEIGKSWSEVLKKEASKVNGTTNGDTAPDHEEAAAELDKKSKGLLTQSLFDILVLQSAFEISGQTGGDELVKLGSMVEGKVELDAADSKRVASAAGEYWRRTGLLFGLLE